MNADDTAQMQLLEAILAAVFIFIAIAVAAVYRVPTNPETFQEAELAIVGLDALNARQSRIPEADDDCNEAPCPFGNDLDRLVSLALGYRGSTLAGSGEAADATSVRAYLVHALPPGAQYLMVLSNVEADTTIAPEGVVAPFSSTSVARVMVAPNWTIHATHRTEGVVVRPGEYTGFGAGLTLRDPLNRDAIATGTPWATLFDTHVPLNATYGTYEVCGGTCSYVTVVPPSMAGAGSFVLPGEQQPAGTVVSAGTWLDLIRFEGAVPADFGAGDPLYLDIAGSGLVTAGDIRLSPVTNCRGTTTCREGTYVRTGDNDIGIGLSLPPQALLAVASADAVLDEADSVWLTKTVMANTIVEEDARISRVGLKAMGTHVEATSTSIGLSVPNTLSATLSTVDWVDADADGAIDEGEPVYLNLQEMGADPGIGPFDIHLTQVAEPTARYAYSVKVVVWYPV